MQSEKYDKIGTDNVWRSRPGHRGVALCGDSTLGVWQPHGVDSYWRMYWGIFSIVRSHSDLGIFDTASEAMMALNKFAADDMRTALLD
jgi:hypothetical protein